MGKKQTEKDQVVERSESTNQSRAVQPEDPKNWKDFTIESLNSYCDALTNMLEKKNQQLEIANKEAKIYKEISETFLSELLNAMVVIHALERKLPFFSRRILRKLCEKYKV